MESKYSAKNAISVQASYGTQPNIDKNYKQMYVIN